jgi:hypothetical protein
MTTIKYLAIGNVVATGLTSCAGHVEDESRRAAAEWSGKDGVQLAQRM